MEINRKELRKTARKQLKGNWLWVIGLLIIPGIIKRFSYAMAPQIMKDMIDSKYEMTATEAISESRKVMKGNKTTLFIIW